MCLEITLLSLSNNSAIWFLESHILSSLGEIVTNHFKQDINDDVINEVIKLLEELNEKDKNKIAKIIKDTIELLK